MRRSTSDIDKAHAEHVGSGPHDGPRCSCHHDGTRWLVMCAAARAHYEAWRQRTRAKRVEQEADF